MDNTYFCLSPAAGMAEDGGTRLGRPISAACRGVALAAGH